MSSSPHFGTGQTHLNSDAKIADEGRPQGAPLPIVFSRRYALGRAPTRGAPTNCLLSALCPGEGTHKGRPYQLSSLGVMPWGGHPQGAPLPIVFSRRYALGRAPTRGAPTNCLLSALCPGEGTHKGRPYQFLLSALWPWGGHPQGAPLLGVCAPTCLSAGEGTHKGRPYRLSSLGVMALGRAPTRGAPTDCLLSALCPGEGTHKGRVMAWGGRPQGAPLPIVPSLGVMAWLCPGEGAHKGRAPTRGAPTDCLLSALCPGEGTHKGRPYRLSSLGVMAWGGRPQGAPLPIVFSRRYGLGRAPTRGAPTDCLLSALCTPGERPWGGHPQGAPLPIVFSRRYALGRAPTRGAPTDALGRAPTRGAPTDCLLSALWPGEGTHKGRPYRLSSLGVMPWGGHPQGAPLPIVFSRRYCPYRLSSLGVMAWGGHPQGAPLPIVFSRRYGLGRAPTRGAPTDCLLSALWPGEGTHKGRPYRLRYALGRAPTRGAPTDLGVMPWGGHPQGAPLPIRYALGRAPTRGAPTDSLCPGEGTHKGRPYRFAMPWGGRPQGAPLPDSGSLTWVCPNLMQLPCILGCTRLRWAGRGHSSEVEEAVARVTVGGCKMAQTFLSVYQ